MEMIPMWLIPALLWTLVWKMIASWRAARNGHLVWFILFWVLNTFGFLPIIYLVFFQRPKKKSEKSVHKFKKKFKKMPALT